jgi:uncharacterized protein
VRQRGYSPKLLVLNTALMTAMSDLSLRDARRNPEFWGRLVESAVGAHLVNSGAAGSLEAFYWRERNREVDFVLRSPKALVAIEVKSGRRRRNGFPGMDAFLKENPSARPLLVGAGGIEPEEFLSRPASAQLTSR